MVSEWLGGIDEVRDVYRGGLMVTDEAALRKLAWLSEAWPDAAGDALPRSVEAMASGCRGQFGADYGLAVGPFPSPVPVGGEPQPVLFALASADGVQQKGIPFVGHPATLRIYAAKHALNFVRLAMLPGH